ncbi:non-specific riboncleoside hydrolase [Virgibacillus halotolerans]|uniref:nucleoside hydrolase n=1 Tax=Virgibacillus halotolerans TaxID=1071053 RepID=UPI0019602D8C|nr:nucleoside hydrolase [Virgibacillus halotolerans]MBM7599242.1 non-specific riboncleoside hydrolase [Virgibacillus halotolerans]
MKRPIIIDTDPGIDDIVAITAALFSDKLDVKLITTVGGNVGITHTTRNAVDLVTFLGRNTPIAKGVDEPLVNKPKTASQVHGSSGVGTYQFEAEGNTALLSKEHAVIELRNNIIDAAVPITLVAIGPLTNIALLFKMFPETKENIKEIVLMGGAIEGGNATPVAEFNIFADPHAAKIVFDSAIKIFMCGLDVTRLTSVTAGDVAKVKEQGTVGEMIAEMLAYYKQTYSDDAITIHDLCTILYLTHPDLFQTKRAKVNVVTEGEAAGHTVVNDSDDGNVFVCVDADVEAFREEFIQVFVETI